MGRLEVKVENREGGGMGKGPRVGTRLANEAIGADNFLLKLEIKKKVAVKKNSTPKNVNLAPSSFPSQSLISVIVAVSGHNIIPYQEDEQSS